MASVEIRVPDLGEVDEVEVIEVLVSAGDEIEADDALVTIESDKASMDVPAGRAGTVASVAVSVGDTVSEGDVIAVLEETGEVDDEAAAAPEPKAEPEPEAEVETEPEPDPEPQPEKPAPGATEESAAGPALEGDHDTQLLVLGSGPGGYTAAFRAADLGLKVTLVERYPRLGGVCLNVGCIPSKTLLHVAEVMGEVEALREHGVDYGEPKLDLDALRGFEQGVVEKLTGGLEQMAKRRGVDVVTGTGTFTGPHTLSIDSDGETRELSFAAAVVAAGSSSVRLPGLPDDPRVIDSTGALALEDVPERLLVVGGGVIGLEMAAVYDALGSEVTVVEMLDRLLPGCDADLVRPLQRRIEARYAAIHLGVKVAGVEARDEGLEVRFEAAGDGGEAPEPAIYDRVLVAVGRRANGRGLGLDSVGIDVEDSGVVRVDAQMRTSVDHVFAIGDVTGGPMLAHRAAHQGKVAAEVAAGLKSAFEARVVPSVAYTDPEVAWTGLGEEEAKAEGRDIEVGRFPWAASGRALSLGRGEGFTKLVFDPSTGRVVGGGVVGPRAGDLIAEIGLAIEMGADARDIGLTVHPHPTLSETVAFAAEVAEGVVTDLYVPKKRGRKRG